MTRMGQEAWLELGLAALSEEGEAGLRVEAITARAGKTRGSFYHHFETHHDFVAGIMARWTEQNAAALIHAASEEAAQFPSSGLSRMTAMLDHRLDHAIRQLAASHHIAQVAVANTDAARLAFLNGLQADPDSDAAADYALIEYAVFVGVQALLPDASPERVEALSTLTSDMIATHWNE